MTQAARNSTADSRPREGVACCFHCAEPIPANSNLFVDIQGERRAVCCYGCLAVAELIASAGLGEYYRFRTVPAAALRDNGLPTQKDIWQAYDQPDLLDEFTKLETDGSRSATLGIDGLGCAACGWLIDRLLKREAGICAVKVNVATARVTVRWRNSLSFSSVLLSLAQLGFKPYPLDAASAASMKQDEQRAALKRLAVAGFGMMQVMMFALPLYADDSAGGASTMDSLSREFLRGISLLCTIPVLLYSGWPILVGAWRAARARTIVMDVPVALGLVLAFIASVWNTWRGYGTVYFDSVVMFVFFLSLARFVEMRARHRTGGVIDALARLLPRTAHVFRRVQHGESVADVSLISLRCGDELLVRPGEIIPADGIIVSGTARLNESMLTGESRPHLRGPGSPVSGGTLNLDASLRVRVTALGQGTVLSGIVNILQNASTDKAGETTSADRIASWFLSRILFGAGLVALAWLAVDPSRAFEATLAVLVATCPCALSLAMPTAIAAATAALAKRGVLIVKSSALETLAKLTCAVFDKTGTLTHGKPCIEGTSVHGHASLANCERLAAALERHSEHPLAQAFASIDIAGLQAADVIVFPGAGIEGTIGQRRYRLGKLEFAATEHTPSGLETDEWVFLGDGARAFASFRISDRVRNEAHGVVVALAQRSIRCEILSGDAAQAVAHAGERCGIDTYRSRQSPSDKLEYVRSLEVKGDVVAMVGDGINDAPVLAGAAVSIAMGKASALAHASADVLLVGNSLSAIPEAIDMAQRTARIVRQNLIWAAAYNLLALPLAALGYVPPWLAAVGMSLSSILVVMNAMRLAPRMGASPAPTSSVLASELAA